MGFFFFWKCTLWPSVSDRRRFTKSPLAQYRDSRSVSGRRSEISYFEGFQSFCGRFVFNLIILLRSRVTGSQYFSSMSRAVCCMSSSRLHTPFGGGEILLWAFCLLLF